MTDIDERIVAAGVESTLAGDTGETNLGVRGPAEQAVTVEPVVDANASEKTAAVVCWLFRANAPPTQFDLRELPQIVAEDGGGPAGNDMEDA